MNKKILRELVKKLNGLNWFIISGFAVEIYTNGQRKAKDVDLFIEDGDAQKFASKLGAEVKHRRIQKQKFVVDDYGFVADFNGQEIEVTTGYPKKRLLSGAFKKILDCKVRKVYAGVEVFVEPVEELIAYKANTHRPKDIIDLKLLKNHKIDIEFLKEIAEDLGKYNKIVNILKEVGYRV